MSEQPLQEQALAGTAPAAGAGLTRKAARTRQRILVAAAHELAEHGYGGTSLRQVAAAAHLQLGSLYFHFASKDELVAETMREGIDFALGLVSSALADLPAGASQRERLRTAVTAHLEALHASQDRAAAVVRMAFTLPPALRQAQAVHERRYGRLWLEVLRDAQQEGAVDPQLDTRALRDVLFGAMNVTLGSAHGFDAADDRIVETILHLLLRGNYA